MTRAVKLALFGLAVFAIAAIGSFSSLPALAQDTSNSPQASPPGQPPQNPGSRNETDSAFDHWMTSNPEAARQIRKDPSLLNNQDYLNKHPELQKFMNDHPDFSKAAAKNPNRLVHKSVHKGEMARQHHREHMK